jgi:SAM-dependent methyltransferase
VSVYWIPRHYIQDFCRREGKSVTGRVLDFGCGSKPYEECLPSATEYVGVEYDKQLGESEHYLRDGVHFYGGCKLPFESNSFDVIVSFQVIEHVQLLEEALSELIRVAKPGARFLLTLPLLWPEHEVPADFRRFTRWGIEKLLLEVGLVVNQVKPMGTVYDVITVFWLDYMNTHQSRLLRKLAPLVATPLNLAARVLNRFDRWAVRSDRFCYLDLSIVAHKPFEPYTATLN